MLCDSRAQLNSLNVPKGRVVTAAGAAGRCVCRLVPLCLPYREDTLVAWRVRAAPPEGESSSLAPPLWEPEKGPCPWEAGSVPYSCWMCTSSVLISVKSYMEA